MKWLCSVLLLLLIPVTSSALTWTWDAPASSTPDGYRFFYSTDGGTSWQRYLCPEATADPALSARLCTGIPPPGSRCYTVRAVYSTQESGNSNTLCYTTTGPVTPPTNLRERP